MPSITNIISQHELLCSLCANLSAADIVHLAATSKEHHVYLTSSKPILKMLLSQASCDGRGIVAQARVFGYWNGDPSQATSWCLGTDAKPCTACGVQVCDDCRFHFFYGWDQFAEFEITLDFEEHAMDNVFKPLGNIQSKKAFNIFWHKRTRRFCEDCHPLMRPNQNKFQRCRCRLFEHFVGERWLCLPCFFVEETKAARIKNERIVRYDPRVHTATPGYRPGYVTEDLCDCGKPAMEKSDDVCRVCEKATGWHTDNNQDIILSKIMAQLG